MNSRFLLRFAAIVLTVCVLAGCGGGGTGSGPVLNPIGGSGGTVYNADRSASLEFPAGALGHDVTVGVSPGQHPPQVGSYMTTGLPAYSVTIKGPDGRAARLGRSPDNSVVLFHLPLPAGFDLTHGIAYLYRSDAATPFLLQLTVDGSNQLTAVIPTTLLHKIFDAALEAPTDFEVIGSAILGLAAEPGNGPSQTASVDAWTYRVSSQSGATGDWEQDNWGNLGNVAGQRIAVVVPGTWNTPDDDKPLADYLGNLGLASDNDQNRFFGHVIAINYNTLANPSETGEMFASRLKQLIANGAQLYLFAHSQGGLVSRWAIEKGGARDVKILVMMGTPNEGIPSVSVEIIAHHKNGRFNDPAMIAMSNYHDGTYSQFLHNLNDSQTPGNAAYFTVTGDVSYLDIDNNTNFWENQSHLVLLDGPDDGVVYLKSARGQTINLSQYCRGGYDDSHNVTLRVVHSNLPKVGDNPPEERQALGRWIRQNTGVVPLSNILSVTVQNNGRATDTGWDSTFKVTNRTGSPSLTADYLQIKTYDRSGNLLNTQWYDPNTTGGDFFPSTQTLWGSQITGDGSVSASCHSWFDHDKDSYWNVSNDVRALTLVATCTGTLESGLSFSSSATVALLDQDGNAAGPPRSVTVRSKSQMLPTMGPARPK
jgi:hypothetical protein